MHKCCGQTDAKHTGQTDAKHTGQTDAKHTGQTDAGRSNRSGRRGRLAGAGAGGILIVRRAELK